MFLIEDGDQSDEFRESPGTVADSRAEIREHIRERDQFCPGIHLETSTYNEEELSLLPLKVSFRQARQGIP